MGTRDTDTPLELLFAGATPEVRSIMAEVRRMARAAIPDAHELFYHGAFGYGPSESPFDRIIYIAPQNGYVNLGFFFGSTLPDPAHRLEGTGKRMRHVKIRALPEASDPALVQLVEDAWHEGIGAVAALHRRAGPRASKIPAGSS